jgi:hypothetical protein
MLCSMVSCRPLERILPLARPPDDSKTERRHHRSIEARIDKENTEFKTLHVHHEGTVECRYGKARTRCKHKPRSSKMVRQFREKMHRVYRLNRWIT